MGLDELRREIDAIDECLVRILNDRAAIARRIGREKAKDGIPVQDVDREKDVLDRVRRMNPGPMSNDDLASLYEKIMDACISVQCAAPEIE